MCIVGNGQWLCQKVYILKKNTKIERRIRKNNTTFSSGSIVCCAFTMASDWVPRDGIDDDDDYENAEFSYKRGREGTIYLIDADKTIIQDADRFRQYLNCIEQDLLKSILVNAQDLVSVVVYNTDKSPDCNEMFRDEDAMPSDVIPSNCAVLIPLKRLDKQLIQYFKNFRESNDFFDFLNKYGTSDDCTLNDAMWLCSRMFIRCSRQLANSKIVLFTANDQPYLPGSGELQQTFVRAGDLRVNNTIIDLVPLVDEDDAFDMSAFYIEFLCAVNDLEPDEIRWHSPSDQRYLMENRLYRRNFRKNCLRHIKWELGDGLAIGCDVHSFTRSANKPTAIKIDRATNEVITAKRSHVAVTAPAGVNADNAADGGPANTATAPDSGIAASVTSAGNLTQGTHSGHMQRDEIAEANEIVETKVLPGELFKSQIVCGKEILFTSEELAQLKTILEPGVRLIGFKPLSTLKARWFVKHCCFLYPDDVKIKGSTKLFRGLWEKCIEKQKYALCVLTMQRKATPRYSSNSLIFSLETAYLLPIFRSYRYIALVPQTQEADNNDGFRIIHLPVESKSTAFFF